MPRKSADALSVVAPLTRPSSGVRLQAPPHLSESAAAVWREVVETQPPGYFDRSQVPLLESLCVATAEFRRLSAWLERVDSLDELARITRLVDQHAARISTASTRLRLTNQSRYNPRQAGNAAGSLSYADKIKANYLRDSHED